ncbi:unnamed protein product, partial [Discosporangium mesarthrocarpum]
TRGYVLTALTKLAGKLGEEHSESIERLLSSFEGSMNLELQARSCEYLQLLGPDLQDLRRGMLDRMPVPDEETMRNRRARFKKEGAGGGEDGRDEDGKGEGGEENGADEEGPDDLLYDNDDVDERALPSFKISKVRPGRPGAGSGSRSIIPTLPPGSGGRADGGSSGGASGGSPVKAQQTGNLLDLD